MAASSKQEMISIISVNYYSGELLHEKEDLISSIDGVEFIIVDNSGEYVPSSAKTTAVKTGENVGFGRACNAGAAVASGDVLAFLNPDADMDIAELLKLARLLQGGKRSIIGPAIYDHRGMVRGLFEPGRFGLRFRRGYFGPKDLAVDELAVPYVSGACMVISAEFFRELGGFYDGIFLYAEDLELCVRATQLGGTVRMHPKYAVQHRGGRSSSKLSARLKRFGRSFNGHFRFFRKLGFAVLPAAVNAAHLASGLRL